MARTMREIFTVSRRELMNDPQFDWTRKQTTRRWLVAAYFILCVTASVTLGLAVTWKDDWLLAAFASHLPAFVFVIGSLNASLRGLTMIKTNQLDEWQISKRDAMFRICWWPGLIIMAAAGYVGAMTLLDPGIKAGLAIGAFFVTLYLPSAALAWTLPEEPEA